MFKLLQTNSSFLCYLAAGGISRLGDVVSGLGFLFLALDLTQSVSRTTGVVIAETLPYLFFGLAGGVIADWFPKKRLLIAIDLLRAPIICSIYLLYIANQLAYWHLVAAGFLIQSLGCFFAPAHRAVLPLLTREEERVSANSLVDSVSRGIQVASPFVTLPLLQYSGPASFFLFDAATYLISAGLLALIRLQEVPALEKRSVTRLFLAIWSFMQWVRMEKRLLSLFSLSFLVVFCSTWVWEVGLLLWVSATVSAGSAWYSLLLGVFGGVVIASNLVIPFVWKKLSLSTYLLGALIWGGGILFLGSVEQPPLLFVGAAIVGVGMPLAGLSRVYLLQQLVPEEMMGRGFSFNAMLLYLANVISLGVFAFLSTLIPLPKLFLASGTLIVAAGASYLYRLRKAPGVIPYTRRNN